MSCLTPDEITKIKAEIVDLDAQIKALKTAYLGSIGNSEVESYRFDSGPGSQRVDRRSPKEIRVELENRQIARARLQRTLDGTLNLSISLQRHRGYGYG